MAGGSWRLALIGALTAPAPGAAQEGTMDRIITVDGADLAAFGQWVAGFRPHALAEGIRPEVYDAAMSAADYLPEVVAKDRNQAEVNRTLWDYLDTAVSETRIANGQRMLADHAALLDRIEAAYGVPKQVVVAVWGMESSYGASRGSFPVISALATLAHDGRRRALFEAQLIAALKILQTAEVGVGDLRGSWAGAMGHTQFMPASWLATAVDFNGDGRRDIWGDDPADALASTAAYLAKAGWSSGQPWGVEVALPPGFDFANSGKRDWRPVADWAALGVRAADGDLSDEGRAALLLPGGAAGPAFLIFVNFRAIEAYNAADAYVLAVGHLSDRLAGKPAIRAAWPRGDRALTGAERRELQSRLTAAGFDTGAADGILGPKSIAALCRFQKANGLPADGYASPAMLERLR